jgi:antitoxin component YwqK of YwqJK toxin-antitoxin module
MSDNTNTPWVEPPPRDGAHTETHDDSDDIRLTGHYERGLKTGAWKAFWPGGQLQQEYHWERGLKHGPELDWSAEGVQVCEGQNDRHVRAGTWTWRHENGKYKQAYTYDAEGKTHGPYSWDTEAGEPRARGAFWHGQRDGEWEWHGEPNHERMVRGYRRGTQHGEDAGWYHGGQLAYRRHYFCGYKHGDENTFYADGSPKFSGTWQWGVPVGEHRSYTEDGAETVTTFTRGIANLPTDKKLASLAKKLAKAKDHWKKQDAIGNVVEYGERAYLAYHLWKEGIYDVAGDPELWELLGSGLAGLFTGEDIVAFLGAAAEHDNGSHLPYWPWHLDRLVMRVYARDPKPIDAAWESLPDHTKKGVAFVRARFGKEIGDTLADEMGALAFKHAKKYGIGDRVLWPDETGTFIDERRLFDQPFREPTQHFEPFIEIFGGVDRWVAELESYAYDEAGETVSRVQFPIFRQLVERAGTEQMITLCNGIALDNFTQDLLHDALWHWRGDDAATMTEIALGIEDTGLRKWPAVCAAVLKHHEEGNDVPQELVDAFVLGTESPHYTSSWMELSDVPEEFRDDPHYIAEYLDLGIGACAPRVARVHEALRVLSEAQVRSIIERYMQAEYGKITPGPFLYLVNDADLWRDMLELVEHDNYGSRPRTTWGFGDIGAPALPLLVEALERSPNQDYEEGWRQAIVVALAHMVDAGDDVPEEYDSHIRFDLARKDRDYSFVRPYLQRVLHRLPAERAVPIIAEALESDKLFWRALALVPSHPTRELVDRAFERVLELESLMDYEKNNQFGAFLKGLPNPRDWARWVLANGGGGSCKEGLKTALGWKAFEELEKEIAEAGVEQAKELDAVDRVLALADKQGNTGEKYYLLRRLEETTTDTLNVIGGAAPGVGADRWPMHDDEPMAHLFTMDLATMPELAEGRSARAISVFCASPDYNEAWEPNSGWTEVLFTTADQLGDDVALPEGVEADHEATFEPVAVHADLSNDDMRKEIWRAGARVLGEPIWLQSDEYWGDFLMQFDESFCHMNLGDSGVMYVFADTAFWQCY